MNGEDYLHCARSSLRFGNLSFKRYALQEPPMNLKSNLENRTFMCDIVFMNGGEFIRRIKKLGKTTDTSVRFESRYGKGSHGRLYYGSRFTTVKDRKKEIKAGLLHAMLDQLGLTVDDIL